MIDKFFVTWKSLIIHPKIFFGDVPTNGGYSDPLIFAAVNYIIFTIVASVGSLIQIKLLSELEIIPDFMVMFFYIISAINLITIPIYGIIGIFTAGVIFFICFKFVGGSGNFEDTVRIFAYISSVSLFLSFFAAVIMFVSLFLPMINVINNAGSMKDMPYDVFIVIYIINFIIISLIVIYLFYLSVLGGKYAHNITMRKSAFAILIPQIVFALPIVLLMVISIILNYIIR